MAGAFCFLLLLGFSATTTYWPDYARSLLYSSFLCFCWIYSSLLFKLAPYLILRLSGLIWNTVLISIF